MKKLFLILFCFILHNIYPQISVGPTHIGKGKKFKKGVVEKFKKTTTIFILNEKYSEEEYKKILDQVWKVTPFKIVFHEDFDIMDYLRGNYSFFQIKGFSRNVTTSSGLTTTSLFINLDLNMYNSTKILSKLEKLSPKKIDKKINDILSSYEIGLAQVPLYPKDEFVFGGNYIEDMYKSDIFFYYNLGLLKNYFQKTSDLLSFEKEYWLYETDYEIDLKELAESKLYVPRYIGVKYNGWIGEDSSQDDDNIKNIFKNYEYGYEIIGNKELSDKIINEENFYYLRYTRRNTEKFLSIVNSITGNIVYRNYPNSSGVGLGLLKLSSFSYKIKPKDIRDISLKIKKALKKRRNLTK